MKQLFIIITALFFQSTVFAADTTLVFTKINYSGVFDLAKKEKKAVMLYFHFKGCGACVTMEKTAFVDPKVIDFFNSNFVCLDVNTREKDGIETNKIYNIVNHPTYLFLDQNGKILHKIVGVFSPADFLLQAKNAVNPEKTLSTFKQRYAEGNRNADFLFDYCYLLRDAQEFDCTIGKEYLATQTLNDLSLEKNIRFLYEFAIYNHSPCVTFGSREYIFMSSNSILFESFFEKDQVETRLFFIVNAAAYDAIDKKDSLTFFQAIDALKKYDNGKEYFFKEMDGRITMWNTGKSSVLSAKLKYYEKTGNDVEHSRTLNLLLENIWNDEEALNNFAWQYYLTVSETAQLEKAIDCSKRSIELNNNYANNDTYACLLFKVGRYEQALKQAEKAIDLAKQKNLDYKETADLVEKIKEKQK